MSLSLEGIGAVLQSDNDYVKVVRLVPAGPAAKSKQIATSDKIIGVAQGKGEMVDVVGWRLDEVVKLIRGPKGSQVRLEVIPASNAPNDQTSKIVAITREAVKLEDQAAKKSIIKVDHEGRSYKLGVIDLPAFYLDFKAYRAGDPNYKSTTRDVKKLVAELQKDKVDGIVLDLRNNGGGSCRRPPKRPACSSTRARPYWCATATAASTCSTTTKARPSIPARWRYWSTVSRPPPRRSSPAPCRTTTAR